MRRDIPVAHTRHHIMDSSRRGISPNVHRRITAVSRILALSAGIWACFAFFFFFAHAERYAGILSGSHMKTSWLDTYTIRSLYPYVNNQQFNLHSLFSLQFMSSCAGLDSSAITSPGPHSVVVASKDPQLQDCPIINVSAEGHNQRTTSRHYDSMF
jgi:hypothetical protein